MPNVRQMIEATATCALYMAVGPALMVLNKEILDSVSLQCVESLMKSTALSHITRVSVSTVCFTCNDPAMLCQVGFRYPILVSWLGLAFAATVARGLQYSGHLELKHADKVDVKFW